MKDLPDREDPRQGSIHPNRSRVSNKTQTDCIKRAKTNTESRSGAHLPTTKHVVPRQTEDTPPEKVARIDLHGPLERDEATQEGERPRRRE